MEQVRIALYVALAVILVFIWQAWRADQVAQAPTVSQEELPRGRTSDAPPMQATPPGATEPPPAPEAPPGADEGPRVVVETDLLRAVIDTRGADLRELALLTYPVDVDAPEQPYLLLAEQPARTFYTQSGLLGEGMPDHQARYSAPAERYRLEPGQERLEVPLSWRGSDGTVVRKVYTFRRDDYVVDLRYELEAPPGASVSAEPYAELVRVPGADAGRSLFNPVSFRAPPSTRRPTASASSATPTWPRSRSRARWRTAGWRLRSTTSSPLCCRLKARAAATRAPCVESATPSAASRSRWWRNRASRRSTRRACSWVPRSTRG